MPSPANTSKLKVPIAKLGSWFSGSGVVSFEQSTFNSIKNNFKKNLVGYEPYLKDGHNKKGPGVYDGEKAEAHMVDCIQEEDVLYGIFEPNNEDVINDVRNGAYRYSSAELIYKAKDKSTGADLGPLLRGVALTNTPFIPNLPRNAVLEDANLALMLSDSPVEIQVIRSELTAGVIMPEIETPSEVAVEAPESSESGLMAKFMDSLTGGLDKWFSNRSAQAVPETAEAPELETPTEEPAEPVAAPATEEAPAEQAPEPSIEETTVTPEEVAQAQADKEAALAKASEAESALAISQAQLQALLDEKAAREVEAAAEKEAALVAEKARKEETFALMLSDRAAKLVSEQNLAPEVAERAKALVNSLHASVETVMLSDGGEPIDLVDAVFSLLSDRKADFELGQVGAVSNEDDAFDPWGVNARAAAQSQA